MAISKTDFTAEDSQNNVKNRLLDAAESLFAAHGYKGTSVRDITTAAKCNVAAVNYHFAGKQNLYNEVFRRRLSTLREIRLSAVERVMSENGCKASLENLLHEFAVAFLEPFASQSHGKYIVKMMTREMLEHHLPKNMFATEMFIPTMTALHKALKKLCPPLNDSKTQLCIHSIIAQLVHVIRLKELIDHNDNPELPTFDLASFINHIVDFSVAAIRACEKETPK
jgi:AcrR family transcriptional regulator